jgi:cobalt-zinc-cadmium efflux system outer membrane protein
MFSAFTRQGLLTACLVFLLPGTEPAFTAPADHTSPSPALTRFVASAVDANPRVQAARATVDAQAARSRGAARPLFNPDLELEYERSEIDTTTLGLSQTLDWHDKRGARESAAEAELEAAHAALQSLREELAGEILTALAELERTARQRDLAAERIVLLQRFAAVHERRAAVGDIGETELQLARLALAEARLRQADADADKVAARTTLAVVIGVLPERPPAFPAVIPAPSTDLEHRERMAAAHPAVQEARLRALAAKRRIHMRDRDRRADPTIGVTGGREDREALIGLRLELPLQVRNDFGEQVEAARAEALQAEREAQDRFRNVLARLDGAHRRLTLMRDALTQWEAQGQPSLEGYAELLEQLWNAGEFGTTDYLVQLRQALDTRIAGAALEGKARFAWVDWLSASGRVQQWLGIQGAGGVR